MALLRRKPKVGSGREYRTLLTSQEDLLAYPSAVIQTEAVIAVKAAFGSKGHQIACKRLNLEANYFEM